MVTSDSMRTVYRVLDDAHFSFILATESIGQTPIINTRANPEFGLANVLDDCYQTLIGKYNRRRAGHMRKLINKIAKETGLDAKLVRTLIGNAYSVQMLSYNIVATKIHRKRTQLGLKALHDPSMKIDNHTLMKTEMEQLYDYYKGHLVYTERAIKGDDDAKRATKGN